MHHDLNTEESFIDFDDENQHLKKRLSRLDPNWQKQIVHEAHISL